MGKTMTDTTSAPGAESPTTPTTETTAAPAETTQSADVTSVSPQAETPAGSPEQQPVKEGVPEKEPSPAEAARKQRNQERWQRMKQETNDARRREQFYLSEIERLKGQSPDYSKITDPDEVLAHKTADVIRRGQIEDHTQRAQAEAETRGRAVQEAWGAIAEDMRAKVPDFDQVVMAPSTSVHQRAVPFIVESEKGGEIAYWLGKNPDAARELYAKFETAPAQAFIELGRIEARLSAPQAKQVSTAPKPAPALNGGANPLQFDVHKASVADVAAQLRKAGIIR